MSLNFCKSQLPAASRPPKNILFTLFNGEAYDYIGSQRFVIDMVEDRFPHWATYVVVTIVEPVPFELLPLYAQWFLRHLARALPQCRDSRSLDLHTSRQPLQCLAYPMSADFIPHSWGLC